MKEIRKKIDRIDLKISSLLDERASLVREIGKLKVKTGTQIFAPEREKQIIKNIISQSASEDGFPEKSKAAIFNEIIAASRTLQRKLSISYLGPEATFTHLAAVKKFSDSCEYTPASSISRVFRDVEKERADYGVVPVENSTEGIVSHTLDMFMDSGCRICSEMLMEISHNLLSKNTDIKNIRRVYSHTQALGQCSLWLEENLPSAEYIEVSSTAKAAELAVSESESAAIASVMASRLYGLNILAESIEDVPENITRFFIIGRECPGPSGQDKTTIMFSVKDRVGVLHDMLVPFKEHNLNLTKIESRPSRAKAWQYIFFVDFTGHFSDPGVRQVLEKLEENCLMLKVVGSYPAASQL